jgi:hypothetical protein
MPVLVLAASKEYVKNQVKLGQRNENLKKSWTGHYLNYLIMNKQILYNRSAMKLIRSIKS